MQPNTYPSKSFLDIIVDYYCSGDFTIHAMLIGVALFAVIGLYLFFKHSKTPRLSVVLPNEAKQTKKPEPAIQSRLDQTPEPEPAPIPLKPIEEDSAYQMIEPNRIEANIVICLVGHARDSESDDDACSRLVATAIKAIRKSNIKAKVKAMVVPPLKEMN